MTVYSVEDFKEYLRGKSNVVIDEFDEFIKECKLIIKLRSEAEKRFKNKKNPKPFLAKSSKGALPLEWQQIDAIMNYEDNGPEEDYFTKTAKDIIKEIEIILFSLRKVLVRTRENERTREEQQIWARTWAFPIDATKAKKEGYDKSSISGNIIETEKYPGCPYCGTHGFTLCEACNKLTCYSGEKNVTCQWCGNSGPIGDYLQGTETFSVDGNY